jgi:hypothetical protein
MANLTDELELQFEKVIENRTLYYSSKESARKWVTIDFAEWLVNKFVSEKYNGK